MEYLDYYDEQGTFLGSKPRDIVHQEGLWHNTVHCWLYDQEGYVYFQIRKEEQTFYTTASGHVLKGETIKEAFQREIKEEIGLDSNPKDATLVHIFPWKMDKQKKDGTLLKDRAKAHVYIDEYAGKTNQFHFDEKEVLGIAKVKVEEALALFSHQKDQISARIITGTTEMKEEERLVSLKDFLVMSHETALEKYGPILIKIKEVLNQKEK